jgi:HlyD family secretion protein
VTAGTVVALNPMALMTDEERREFQGSKGANKKDWGGLAKGKDEAGAPGAEGAKASPIAGAGKGEAAATGKPGDPAAKGKAKAKGKGRTKGAGGGAFMAKFKNIPEEDRARLKTASPEERAEIMKKAGFTDEELEQMKQFRGGGGGGGGGGWGGGGGGRGAGGPPGGGN